MGSHVGRAKTVRLHAREAYSGLPYIMGNGHMGSTSREQTDMTENTTFQQLRSRLVRIDSKQIKPIEVKGIS